jgi:capsular exopolysaccharide synthesis family protein
LLLLIPASYESTAKVVIDPPGSEAFSLQGTFQNTSEPDYIETQAQILRSGGVGVEVVRALKLDCSPLVIKKSWIEAAIDWLQFNTLLKYFRDNTHNTARVDITHLAPAEMRAFEYVKSHIVVAPIRNSRVIEIIFRSANPELASQIVNTVVQKFVDDDEFGRYDAVRKSWQWLTKQLEDVQNKARYSQLSLKRYREGYGIVDVDDTQNTFSERERELIHYHAQAQAERIEIEALLLGVRSTGIGSVPQFRDNPMTQQLALKSAEVSGLLSQALVMYGEKHPEIEKLRNELANIKELIEAHERNMLIEFKTSYGAAQAREKTLAQEVNQEAALLNRVSRYGILRREAQADEDLYNSLYARVKEAGISAGSKSSNIRVIERGLVPSEATWPNLLLMLPIGLIVACFGGLAAAVVRNAIDGSVRSPEDLSFVASGPRLILIPETRRRGWRNGGEPASGGTLNADRNVGISVQRFMLEQPASAAAESIRSLMGLILLTKQKNRAKVLLIASPFPREGKTTVAYNLALGLAEKGPTCFVDADLRKPSDGVVGGLLAHYRNAVTAEEIETPSGDCANLTCVGSGTGPENPISVLISDKFRRFTSAIRSRYEFIVIDSPPLLPYADGRFLAALADGAVLVGYAGLTGKKAFESAADILTQQAVPILGVVLNGVRAVEIPYRAYY